MADMGIAIGYTVSVISVFVCMAILWSFSVTTKAFAEEAEFLSETQIASPSLDLVRQSAIEPGYRPIVPPFPAGHRQTGSQPRGGLPRIKQASSFAFEATRLSASSQSSPVDQMMTQ